MSNILENSLSGVTGIISGSVEGAKKAANVIAQGWENIGNTGPGQAAKDALGITVAPITGAVDAATAPFEWLQAVADWFTPHNIGRLAIGGVGVLLIVIGASELGVSSIATNYATKLVGKVK